MKKLCILVLLAFSLLSTGCVSDMFAPKEDPTVYYLLKEKLEPTNAKLDLEMNILPTILPSYTARNQIVSLSSSNRMEVSDVDRWGESLDSAVLRVIYLDLSNIFGKSSVIYAYPFAPYDQNVPSLRISIYEFIGEIGKETTIKAYWGYAGIKDSKELVSGTFKKTIPNGSTYASYVDSMSQLLADLSLDIAEKISKYEESVKK